MQNKIPSLLLGELNKSGRMYVCINKFLLCYNHIQHCHCLIFSILFKNISVGCDILKYIFDFSKATAIEQVKLNQTS